MSPLFEVNSKQALEFFLKSAIASLLLLIPDTRTWLFFWTKKKGLREPMSVLH